MQHMYNYVTVIYETAPETYQKFSAHSTVLRLLEAKGLASLKE